MGFTWVSQRKESEQEEKELQKRNIWGPIEGKVLLKNRSFGRPSLQHLYLWKLNGEPLVVGDKKGKWE